MAETRSCTYEKGFFRLNFLKGIRISLSARELIGIFVGFLIAMASPLQGLAPFGVAYLAQERRLKPKSLLVFAAVSIGSFLACGRWGGVKYTASGLIYLSGLFVLKRGIRLNDTAAGLLSGVAILVSGAGMLIFEGITPVGIALLVCEGAAAMSATLMMEKSIRALKDKDFSPGALDNDTRLSLCAVILIAVMGLREVYMGSSLSLMLVVATVLLLVVSVGCGVEYSAGAGVILGIVCGMGSDFFMPVLGAFSFCGFLSGLLSRFGKSGVVAGVVLANGVMAVYTGTAMEAVLSLYEVLVAAVIFGFVPAEWINRARTIVCVRDDKAESLMRIRSGIKSRLSLVAAAVENMARTVNGFAAKEYSGEEDVSVLFDRTVDKVCKKCRKSDVCWVKNFDSTYAELSKLLDIMQSTGVAKPEDISHRLAANCVNPRGLIDELNHQFDIYRVNRVCNRKLSESRRLVGKHLGGVSDIMERLSGEIDSETGGGVISACEIQSRLEISGIRVKSVNVVDDLNKRHRVELVVKTANTRGRDRRTIGRIVKSISGCGKMTKEEVLENKKLTRLVFSEEERFAVETECVSRGMDSENGDNFRMIHLKGGKFVIALSDGMGTGERAARESRAILELVDSLLEAGFDCRTAVKMINSIMIMRSEENFVTLDLCVIDLYTGEVRFVKTGAEPSFILNKGGRVRTIKAQTLPVGLVADAEAGVSGTKIQDGDKIVMMTDGVSMSESKKPWVDGFLRDEALEDGKISEKILNRAISENRGVVRDDMTVLAVKLKAVG